MEYPERRVFQEYFFKKKRETRAEVVDLDQHAAAAQEVAWKIFRLCFPSQRPIAMRQFWNNTAMNRTVKELIFDIEFVYRSGDPRKTLVVEVRSDASHIRKVSWCDLHNSPIHCGSILPEN